MSLYQIIKSLQTTQGNNAKQAILDANKDNELLRQYFKAMLDPAINYYTTKLPDVKGWKGTQEFDIKDIQYVVGILATRTVTGSEAKASFGGHLSALNEEGRELMGYIIKRKIDKANVGETMVLKTWPGLFFIPPYMRCSSMDDKVRAYYAELEYFYVQTKRDGSFAYLLNSPKTGGNALTRQGSYYPKWFADRMAETVPMGYALVGEMEVHENGKLLDRKTGNGILNSVLQGGEEAEFAAYEFHYVAWDMLTIEEFKIGKSTRNLETRFSLLECFIATEAASCIELVDNWKVTSVAEANAIHTRLTKEGKEGTVWKTPEGEWRDSSSGTKDAVKNKVVFEVDLEILDYYEGEGKAAGMLGGITVGTPCRKLITNCGSGFSDKQRKELWAVKETLPGGIASIEANDVVSSKGKDTLSLFLPIVTEIRFDKKEADSLERVYEQLEAAKNGNL